MPSKVTPLRLSAARAEEIVRQRAQDSKHVIVGEHARKRMAERDITIDDVFKVLRRGSVEMAPTMTRRKEWQCKLVHRLRGIRSVGVVTIILHGEKLFIKTVEWEDLR